MNFNKLEPVFKNIAIENYSYHLPDERIAKYPLENRDESKLLYFRNNKIDTLQFKQLPDILQKGDLLIFNDAKVIQARLAFIKESGAHIEIFCLEPHNPADYNLAFQMKNECEWKCLVGNLKKWKSGKLLKRLVIKNLNISIEATRAGKTINAEIIHFKWYLSEIQFNNTTITFGDLLEAIGSTPLPPYLNREAEEDDKIRYQTIYAKIKGSVAAPTAGLHFTENVFKSLGEKGIETASITLHVSAGTFRPVKSETIAGHEMHEEHFEISLETIDKLIHHEGRIIGVGTTTVRTLESLFRIGIKISNNEENPLFIDQWDGHFFNHQIDVKHSLLAIKNFMIQNRNGNKYKYSFSKMYF